METDVILAPSGWGSSGSGNLFSASAIIGPHSGRMENTFDLIGLYGAADGRDVKSIEICLEEQLAIPGKENPSSHYLDYLLRTKVIVSVEPLNYYMFTNELTHWSQTIAGMAIPDSIIYFAPVFNKMPKVQITWPYRPVQYHFDIYITFGDKND